MERKRDWTFGEIIKWDSTKSLKMYILSKEAFSKSFDLFSKLVEILNLS